MNGLKEGYKDTEIGVIPVEWDVKSLLDFCVDSKRAIVDGPFGSNLKTIHYFTSGVPVIQSNFVTSGKFNAKKYVYVKQEKFEKEIRSKVIPGDIIMAKIGANAGTCAIMPDDHPISLLSGNSLKISIDNTKSNNQFINFILKYKYLLTNLTELKSVGAQPAISMPILKKMKLPFPPLKEQEKIADILSTVDDKIDAIATQIEKAETLKKGLLQKLLSEGIGHSEFKDSELGKIPESWKITTIGKSSKNFDGQRVPLKSEDRQEIQGDYPYYGAQGIIDYVNDYIFDGEYLLVAEDGENVKGQKYDIAFVVSGKFWVNNHAHILQASDNMDLYFISSVLNHINIIKYVTGTGQPKLNKAQLNSIKIPLPPLEEQKQIAEILSTADEKLEVLRAKKEKYQTLKKGLLQKLLSGEVRVNL